MEMQRRLLKYVLVYKGRLSLAVACSALVTGCQLFVALLVQWFLAAGQGRRSLQGIPVVEFGLRHGWFQPSQVEIGLIVMVAVLLVLVHIPRGWFAYCSAYLVSSVTNRVGTDVRGQMYAHLQTLPLSYFHRSRIGDIMARMSYDVSLIQNSSTVLTQAMDGPLMMIGGLANMFVISWKLTLVTIVFVPIMGVAIDRLAKKMRPLTVTTQGKLANANAVMEESIRGVRIIKSFGTEDQEVKRFGRANTESLVAALRAARRGSAVLPSIEFMGAAAVSFIALAGGWMMATRQMTFPALGRFTVLAFSVAAAAKQFGRLNVLYQQTMAGAERVFELLDAKSDMPDKPDGVVLENVQGRVEFRDVRFEYNPDELVLDRLSFTIEPGEIVAIVGPSGAGKSTVADLIPRFYDVTGGQILVEGHDVRDIKVKSLREQIAMVPQETILFSGTIADNISYGRPGASVEEIIEVARAANAHDFIEQATQGYQTYLGEGGVGLSGGQRQRISIARALLKNPKILILDEATSSLDAASEGIVQDALDRLMRGRSTLVIAHRLSTVTGADRILVMDHGCVVESGSFDELVSRGGLFAQLYHTQFRAEEAV